MSAAGSIEADFYAGHYCRVLAETIDGATGACAAGDVPFVIGALTFRGRLGDAEAFATLRLAELDERARAICDFFLGIGQCRAAAYARARRYLGAALRRGGAHADPVVRIFAWQGVGFYRWFFGRYEGAYAAARRSLTAAIEARHLYGKALASDLMAHSQVGPGRIAGALAAFDDAERYAALLGDGSLRQAIRVSRAIHGARHGLDPAGDVDRLERLAAEQAPEDNYTRAELLLELGRQHTLRGRVEAARAVLDRACQAIHGAQLRQMGVTLNLRYAHLALMAGDGPQALNLVRNAAKELDPAVDRSLALETAGLERRALRAVGLPAAALVTPVGQGSGNRAGRLIHRRIEARERGEFLRFAVPGDDPLGDLLDQVAHAPADAVVDVVRTGYLGLLHAVVPEACGRRLLCFDLELDALTIFDRGEVRHVREAASGVLRRLAQSLAVAKPVTKQALIEAVWGYRYNALRHDALVYRSISRLRQLLGDKAAWLEATETGYRLAAPVVQREVPAGRLAAAEEAPAAPPPAAAAGLNHRQMRILGQLRVGEAVGCGSLAAAHGVSEITARRDLSELVALKLLVRHGKGRATRYALA